MSTLDRLVPGAWTFDPVHSEVGFTVRHAGISKVHGTFREVTASLNVGEQVEDSTIEATVQTASVDTANSDRDVHLRSEDFFNVEKFPTMTFTSSSVELAGGEGTITGELTLNGVTKVVELETEFNGVVVDAFGATRAGFEAKATISRKEFGLTWNAAIEAGGMLVSDKVVINLDVAFTAPEA
ncbi:YceI family protein [Kocuria coralli]|uniref:YceI family protein n=1 Tax=Kocuria coralli TaxID=1461025 RepID=A0A5J5KU74_9MICC|nr:YceI family protein [Kocuria coralli]KAA9392918.1 YceI family protein [Kocuria coralli]